MDVLSELAKARQLVQDGKLSLEDYEALVIGYRHELAQLPDALQPDGMSAGGVLRVKRETEEE
jgi:hypothetical protein